MNTITESVRKTMKRNRWLTAAQVADNVYGDPSRADAASRRIRALREDGTQIQTRQKGNEFQYRRVS